MPCLARAGPADSRAASVSLGAEIEPVAADVGDCTRSCTQSLQEITAAAGPDAVARRWTAEVSVVVVVAADEHVVGVAEAAEEGFAVSEVRVAADRGSVERSC